MKIDRDAEAREQRRRRGGISLKGRSIRANAMWEKSVSRLRQSS